MARKNARPADRKRKAKIKAAMASPKQRRERIRRAPLDDGMVAGLAMAALAGHFIGGMKPTVANYER